MNILMTGVSGYVGSLVAARLLRAGHDVRGFARDPARVTLDVPTIAGDAVTGAGLSEALAGVEVAYFLIHSMEAGASGAAFGPREREAAERFAAEARRAGVRRIVYLGGPAPATAHPSPHLHSRLAVERILLGALPEAIALRASIVIGAGSRSFRLLVRLVERLRVLAVPAWGANRTAPIDERDIVTMLVRCADAPAEAVAGRALDAAGPDIVSYAELIARIADAMLVDRPVVDLRGVTATPLASRLAARVAGESPELIEPLMESLETDLLGDGPPAAAALGVRVHSLDAAIEHALAEWERSEPLAAR